MKILGLIPARGGSKGVPGKNSRMLAGKSLVHRAFECASASGVLDRLILSTDDFQIAESARSFGLEVPFMRPQELAVDTSPMIDVAVHALKTLQAMDRYRADALLLLQPTSPLRSSSHIRMAVELLRENDSVCSVVPIPKDLCPHYVMRISESGYLDYFLADAVRYTRRQDVPQAYKRDGTIFLTRSSVLIELGSFYGARCCPLQINPRESLNIDSEEDWKEAEEVLCNYHGPA